MTIDPPASRSMLILALQRKYSRAGRGDLADLALLRRNLPRLPGEADPRAIALIAPHCGATSDARDAGLLIACLWAARHRAAAPAESTWNVGQALRATPEAARERAWRSLCMATTATLPRRMAEVLDILARCGVATDWHRLHRDLRSWHQGFRHLVLGRWSTGLFGPAPNGTPPHRASQSAVSDAAGISAIASAHIGARPVIPQPARLPELSS
jgi:hypothetical protein